MAQFDDLIPDQPAGGAESKGAPNQFDDLVPKRDRSFLGASLVSGLQSVPAALGRIAELNPFTTSPEEIAILEKDPKKREEILQRTQAATALSRGRAAAEARASQTMREVRPEDADIQEKEYATLDPEKSALLSPTRVAGDVLRNLPNVAIMAAGSLAARGAFATAESAALAAGATPAAARAAGAAASARTMGSISAVGEGSLGYAQQAGATQEEILRLPDSEFLKNPEYLALLEKGYQPDAAKQIIAARTAQAAGLAGGIADLALGKAGGELLGGLVGGGGSVLSRAGRGFAIEAGQEGLQSAGEQVGANIAKQQGGFEGTGIFDDLAESVVGGAVVGGITGGGFGAIAGKPVDTAKALKERQDVLNATAVGKQVEAETGLTPSQNAALQGQQRQLAPKLSPIQENIRAQASSQGFDPDTALIISSIETGGTFNPTLKNKNSSAHGLFQMLDGTWTQYGGGDRNNVDLQVANGIRNLLATSTQMEASLLRVPSPVEMYLGQLLGAQGALTVLQADDNASILDVVKKYDAANAEAIVKNNGMDGMTVKEAKEKWGALIERHRAKLGLNPALTEATQAGTDIDGVLGEIDALLQESDAAPLTPRELEDGTRERSLLETREGSDVDAEGVVNAALEAQDAGIGGATRVAPVEATLPQDLRGATPTYYSGAQGYNMRFESDLDKAAYIIANNQSRSKRDADYLQFVMDNTGMTAEEARAYGKQVRERSRTLAKQAGRTQDGAMLTINITPSEGGKFNEGFVSNDELNSRQKYLNPNDGTPFTQTPILAASDEAAVGKTLKEVKPAPGQVFAVSHESDVAPPDYVRAVQQTLQTWVNRFSPTMRLIASFRTDRQQGQKGAQVETAWFKPRTKSLGRGAYQINARPLYNFGVTEDGSRNSTTQAKAAYSLAHEFGHALVEHEFLRDLNPDQQNIVNTIGTWEYFGEDFLSTLPPEKAAVLREYNELKRLAETDAITGVAWATRWLSPWKLAHGTGTKKGVESFLNKFLGEGASRMSARQMAETFQARGDMLSVHEYMAEQMSRYAQSTNAFKGTPLEGNQFFARTFEILKDFFRSLKATKAVAPGTAFKDWVDSLTRMNQETLGEASGKAPVPPKAGKPRIRRSAVAVLPPSIIPPPTETQATVERHGPSEGQKAARALLNNELDWMKYSDPTQWSRLSELVRTGQLEEFKNQVALDMDPEDVDKLRWDTSNPEDLPWKNTLDQVEKVMPKKAVKSWVSDGFRKLADSKYYVMTMRQMAYANPENAGLQLINNTLTIYKSMKAWLEVDSTKVAQDWSKLGKEQRGLVEKGMREEFNSGENWFDLQTVNGKIRFVPSEKIREYASKNGIDEGTIAIWMASKNTYLQHMNTLHNVLRRRLQKRLAESPATLRAKMKELADTFQEIRERPFIPQTRFGQYAIRVEEGDKVLHLEYFETPQQRDAAVTALKGKVGEGRKVIAHNYTLSSSILRTIPPQLLSTYASEMELTRDQKKELREMLELQTSNPQIRRYSSQLAQITGAGKDLLRSYADFMWHDSTNVAKMFAREEFNHGLRMINEDRTFYQDDFEKHDELSQIYNFADSYVKHILNPADEYSMVRSFVVVKQLWGNIKTAIANVNSLTQLWAVASTRQGLYQGTKTVGKTAGGQVVELFDRLSNLVIKGPQEAYKRLAPEERRAMMQAQERGILDETFAAQLASFANVGTLERLNSTGNKWTKRVLWAGMQPQHLVENYTRRVTFLASFRGYRAEGMDFDRSFDAAQRDTLLLQGDNSLQNRPPFMRGKAALFTIYYGYMQNMLYLMSGGYERARRRRAEIGVEKAGSKFNSETVKMWMAYAFLGGLMGLPGAEDLDAILGLVAEKVFGKRFDLKEYAYELAASISEGASEFGLDINPRSIVHGNLADATAFGLLPAVDLSASMSLGNALPGMGGLGELGQRGGGYQFLISAMGPLGREVDSITKLFNDDPSLLKKFNLIAPAGVKNFATGWNEAEAGALYPSGGKVTRDLATGEVRDMTTGEVLARMMGFSPTVQTANRELHYMQKDAEMYWVNKRNTTLTQYWEAVRQGDREAMADAREKVAEFNEEAPAPMRLDGGDLSKSVKARQRRARADELGIPISKQSRSQYADMADTFRGRPSE